MYPKKSGIYISIFLLLCIVAFDIYMQSVIVAKNNSVPSKSIFRDIFFKEKKSTALYPLDFIKWVKNPKHGLVKKIDENMIGYEIQYKPKEYMVCLQERALNISDTLLKRKVQDYAGMEFFDLKIIVPKSNEDLLMYNLGRSENIDSRIKYFAFEFQKDIRMVYKGDTMPCSLFHYERSYGIAPFSNFLLGFDIKMFSKNEDVKILVKDKVLAKKNMEFVFNESTMNHIPELFTSK